MVDAVGPGVTHPAVGDRVVVYHLIGCGHCEHCRRGEPGFCREMQGFNWVRDGVDAEYVVVPARSTRCRCPTTLTLRTGHCCPAIWGRGLPRHARRGRPAT